jgi:hypothetical protein
MEECLHLRSTFFLHGFFGSHLAGFFGSHFAGFLGSHFAGFLGSHLAGFVGFLIGFFCWLEVEDSVDDDEEIDTEDREIF